MKKFESRKVRNEMFNTIEERDLFDSIYAMAELSGAFDKDWIRDVYMEVKSKFSNW